MERTTRRASIGLLALLGLLAGCAVEDAALEARRCEVKEDCPPGRACLDRACVLPDADRTRVLCQGSELRTVRVVCDDYRCEDARIEVLEQIDCTAPPEIVCDPELDRQIEQGPGTCDSNLGRCVYPPAVTTDCLATRQRCAGDALITESGVGCDPDTNRCRVETDTIDCRDEAGSVARCDPDSNRFLVRSAIEPDVAACNPLNNACRPPTEQVVDCSADAVTCEGDTLRVKRNGVCLNDACVYNNVAPVDCAAEPPPTCDGDLLIKRGTGGVCDPTAGACRYPDPQVEDCSREQARCDGDVSRVRPASTCDAELGRCADEAAEIDCTAERPPTCVEGGPPTIRLHPGGVCNQGSGRCAYPEPVVEPCPTTRECDGDVSQVLAPTGCEAGACTRAEEPSRELCAAPTGFCADGVAFNYARPERCDPADGRCIGPDVPPDSAEPCPAELFCEGNRLFGPDEPNCAVADGRAACRRVELLDCNRAPAPTCDGDRQVAHVGPGACSAVNGCLFGDAVETDCAACLPAGAICVLPGTVRLPPAEVDLGPADAPLPARFEASLVMMTTEVSRAEVEGLTGRGLLRPLLGGAPDGCGDDCPATGLSWIDAVAIANAFSARDGLQPCYDRAGRVVGGAGGDPYLCEGWRLPTEVEWLAAWRAGTATRWPCGDAPECLVDDLDAHLAGEGPRAVGTGEIGAGDAAVPARHGAGLYDMGGNAREWMHDVFAPLTGGREPYGPSDGTVRVLRGGSWLTGPAGAAATARDGFDAHTAVEDAGVRLVRGLAPRPPDACQVDLVSEQAVIRRIQGRGACALTPGVPCAYETQTERCVDGCRAGACLRDGDLLISSVEVEGIDIGNPDGPGGPDGPDEEPMEDGSVLPTPLIFAEIPAGVFTHGSGADARRTTIAHDFWLMTTELSYVQFQYLLGERGLEQSNFPMLTMRTLLREQVRDCVFNPTTCRTNPAFGLQWLDAIRIANNLSISEGLPPCYGDEGQVIDGGATADPQLCLGYRLPTEAEWTYAARAGGTDTWACGDDPLCLGQSAIYGPNSGVEVDEPADCPCRGEGCPLWTDDGLCRLPAAYDATPANPWGLIGMTGNVAEWVSDFGDDAGPAVGGRDPYRPPDPDRRPVLKGGAWYQRSDALRLDARAVPDTEVFPAVAAGVRLARTVPAAELSTVSIIGPRSVGDITVTGSFEISTHEVTRALAVQLGARDVSLFGDCGSDCSINWIERGQAAAVANALSLRHGLQPCYTADGGVRASAHDDPYRCEGWRLPTEAEWRVLAPCDGDCAADRAWTLCTSGFDDDEPGLDSGRCSCEPGIYAAAVEACGFPADALPHPACAEAGSETPACFGPRPVGSRPPDVDGLYDRAGNLAEWLHDHWSADPPSGVDPYVPLMPGRSLCGEEVVDDCFTVMGGSWADPPTAIGERRPQAAADDRTGFRLVRSLPGGDAE